LAHSPDECSLLERPLQFGIVLMSSVHDAYERPHAVLAAKVHSPLQHVKASAQQWPKLDRWRLLLVACICQ
jgi:hypothetical protein